MKHLLTINVHVKQKDGVWMSDMDRYKVLNAITNKDNLKILEAAMLSIIPEIAQEKIHVQAE